VSGVKWIAAVFVSASFASSVVSAQQGATANASSPPAPAADAAQLGAGGAQSAAEPGLTNLPDDPGIGQPQPNSGAAPPQNGSLQQGNQARPSELGSEAITDANREGARGELGIWLVEANGPGVRIRRVSEGSAADKAGLRPGDVLMSINDQAVSSPAMVSRTIHQMPVGQAVTLEIWRDGRTQEISATIGAARESVASDEGNDPYQVGFRGDGEASGDLSQRVMRLERQLGMMTQEMGQMRQQLMQMNSGAAGSVGGAPSPTIASPAASTGLEPSGGGALPTDPTSTPDAGQSPSGAVPSNQPASGGAAGSSSGNQSDDLLE